ncbi:FAD-binding oxidoreductase [Gluconacetobacter azotocaptans]|uniref:FAD-binding oxidoreductase n=1 Tax=Gluconacetobacter azotocaptans TaxID=142834 RepID=A0A7W4JVX4_9PROT|nr:FAD-binding oxidoreductase [Gluconacetobacter azotocaptans]MBB2191901.1 FAD-binding oxidoreductase [Gluconacetobacter azotocaptans]GBQ33373.1 glycine/D-amino acid oxidase [Gluconacetobacter azotocaptans DSM 13594]
MAHQPSSPDVASLWQETAVPRVAYPALARDARHDVAIIGGGYTGLVTARALARRGLSPIVLDANRIGWGASGRNGGVVSGKFRLSLGDIASAYGVETARRMHGLAQQAVEHVGELIAAYDIPGAAFSARGSLRCAHNPRALARLRAEAEWLGAMLGDPSYRILSAGDVAAETGSRGFVGGMLNVHGGIIHPLNYARGIAAGIVRDGIALHEDTPVLRMRREGAGVCLETPGGVVRAGQVVLASNAWSDLTPATRAIQRRVIPFRSAMIATEPLQGAAAGLLSGGRSYTETRRMMRWFRKAGDRLIYGGRGAFGRDDKPSAFAALQRAMVRQFPELSGVRVTHRWSGLVAMTLDSLPHVGRFDDRVVYAAGYNGTGVALASYIGTHVAALVAGDTPDLGPLTGAPWRPIPLYGVREPAVRAVAGWYQFLDAIGR